MPRPAPLTLLALALLALLAHGAAAQHWVQTYKVRAFNGSDSAYGFAVAIDGDTLVGGANIAFGGTGTAYVHAPDPALQKAWTRSASFFQPSLGPSLGRSVGVDGDTIVIAAPGAEEALVYERDQGGPGAWGEVRRLTGSAPSQLTFGRQVAIDGDTIAVRSLLLVGGGSPDLDVVYVFERDQGGADQWGEVARVDDPQGAVDHDFGAALDLADGLLLVGAPGEASNAGAAYVFERDLGGPSAYGLRARLEAPAPAAQDRFGFSVAVSGNGAAVGVPSDVVDNGTGSVMVFRADAEGWSFEDALTQPPGADDPSFGHAVALEGDRLAVGCYEPFGADPFGCAYVFERDPGTGWDDGYALAPCEGQPNDAFGSAVALSGDRVVVGAQNDKSFLPLGWVLSGAVYVFESNPWPSTPWTSYCTAGTSAKGCTPVLRACGAASASHHQGFSLSVDGGAQVTSGLFFYAANGRQAAPWGNGTSYQCVVPPVRRGSLLVSGPDGQCNGTFFEDLNARWCPSCPKAHHNPGSGTVVQAQLWYRDSANTSNKTTSLSNAVEFTVGP